MAFIGEFKIPECPQPMATMESEDEESFVVLGQSLMPEVDLSFKNLTIESIKSEPIEEGKQLFKNMEMSKLQTSHLSEGPSIPEIPKIQDPTISMHSMSGSLVPGDIQEKIELLIDENVKLRDIIIKNNAAMEFQHEKIVSWKEEVHNTHKLHKEKFAEAKKYIANLVLEKDYLTAELEKNKEIRKLHEEELIKMKELQRQSKQQSDQTDQSSTSITEKEKSSVDTDALKIELKEAIDKRNELKDFLKIVYTQKDSLKKERDEMELSKNSLISELKKKDDLIAELRDQLKHSEEISNRNISLISEIESLQLSRSLNINLKQDLDDVRKQLLASQQNITRLLQTNSALEAELNTEREKLKELKKLESLKEDYEVIQKQLDIYKADFEEERRLKASFKAENKQLANDFQHLQKRNGELQEELQLFKERGWQYVNNDRRTSSASSASTENRFMCPICKFGFLTIQALENHVDRCIDLNNTLP